MLSAVPEKRKLGAMVGVLVDLPMVELRGLNGLPRRKQSPPLFSQPGIRCELAMLVDPRRKRRKAALRLYLRGIS
jgi:hypothetical protein